MKHIIRIAAILLMLALLLVLIPSSTNIASAEIIEYDLKDKKGVPLQQDGYDLENMTYEDPSITVKITTGRFEETNYMVAYVKVANATQVRSTMSGSYSTDDTIGGIAMAKSTNAALPSTATISPPAAMWATLPAWARSTRTSATAPTM